MLPFYNMWLCWYHSKPVLKIRAARLARINQLIYSITINQCIGARCSSALKQMCLQFCFNIWFVTVNFPEKVVFIDWLGLASWRDFCFSVLFGSFLEMQLKDHEFLTFILIIWLNRSINLQLHLKFIHCELIPSTHLKWIHRFTRDEFLDSLEMNSLIHSRWIHQFTRDEFFNSLKMNSSIHSIWIHQFTQDEFIGSHRTIRSHSTLYEPFFKSILLPSTFTQSNSTIKQEYKFHFHAFTRSPLYTREILLNLVESC